METMTPDRGQGGGTVAHAAALALACILLAGSHSACDYFEGLVSSGEQSSSSYTFVVVDTCGDSTVPVVDAWVELDGRCMTADSTGVVSFGEVPTGVHSIRAGAGNFLTLSAIAEVTLDGGADTLRLERVSVPPSIDTFYVTPSHLRACDDSVNIILAIRRTVWPVTRLEIYPAYPDTEIVRPHHPGGLALGEVFRDTIPFSYHENGGECGTVYRPRMVVMDECGNTAETSSDSVYLDTNRRPTISLGRIPFFYDSIENSIQVRVDDPDGNLRYAILRWGDGTETIWREKDTSCACIDVEFAHIYWLPQGEGRDTVPIEVLAFDSSGAQAVHTDTVRVLRLPPLIVARTLEYHPDQVLNLSDPSEPVDTAITMAITVVSSPGYIESVLWHVYPCTPDPSFEPQWHYETFTEEEGGIPPWGRTFTLTYDITTQPVRACDSVSVTLVNSYGRSERRTGVFYQF